MKHCVLTAMLLLIAAGPIWAQEESGQETIAQEKTAQELSIVCAACHGADGNSAMAMWPKLAGQHEQYLTRQSIMIREGQRMVPQMMGIVANMSDEQLGKVAEYYSQQPIKPGAADPELVPLGKRIYHTGLLEKNVAACQSCHGPVGAGNPFSGYPKVAGQHAEYLTQRLQKYRNGEANGVDDPYSAQMVLVAANLSDHEIAAVASYLQGMYDKRTTK